MATTRVDIYLPLKTPDQPDVLVKIEHFAREWSDRDTPDEVCMLVAEASQLHGLGYKEFAPGNMPRFIQVLGSAADYTFIATSVDEAMNTWYSMVPEHASVAQHNCCIMVIND